MSWPELSLARTDDTSVTGKTVKSGLNFILRELCRVEKLLWIPSFNLKPLNNKRKYWHPVKTESIKQAICVLALQGGGVAGLYSFLSTTRPRARVFGDIKREQRGFFIVGGSDMWVTRGIRRAKRQSSSKPASFRGKQTDAENNHVSS